MGKASIESRGIVLPGMLRQPAAPPGSPDSLRVCVCVCVCVCGKEL